ncbi:MAG TPA: site-specific integrase [Myxococcales bacterium]|jgi:site-specific recombinase XerD
MPNPNPLAPPPQASQDVPALPQGLVDAARAYAKASRAPRTLAAYQADWRTFTTWCQAHGLPFLPAAPQTVALYLADRAQLGRKPATLARELAAISQAHKTAGHESPRGAARVREVLAGIRRTHGTAQRRVSPLLPGDLRALVRTLPEGLLGVRDRALLLVGFAGALRRSELAALAVEDLVFNSDGLELTLRRSKTDQEGAGEKRGLPFGSDKATCPDSATRCCRRCGPRPGSDRAAARR